MIRATLIAAIVAIARGQLSPQTTPAPGADGWDETKLGTLGDASRDWLVSGNSYCANTQQQYSALVRNAIRKNRKDFVPLCARVCKAWQTNNKILGTDQSEYGFHVTSQYEAIGGKWTSVCYCDKEPNCVLRTTTTSAAYAKYTHYAPAGRDMAKTRVIYPTSQPGKSCFNFNNGNVAVMPYNTLPTQTSYLVQRVWQRNPTRYRKCTVYTNYKYTSITAAKKKCASLGWRCRAVIDMDQVCDSRGTIRLCRTYPTYTNVAGKKYCTWAVQQKRAVRYQSVVRPQTLDECAAYVTNAASLKSTLYKRYNGFPTFKANNRTYNGKVQFYNRVFAACRNTEFMWDNQKKLCYCRRASERSDTKCTKPFTPNPKWFSPSVRTYNVIDTELKIEKICRVVNKDNVLFQNPKKYTNLANVTDQFVLDALDGLNKQGIALDSSKKYFIRCNLQTGFCQMLKTCDRLDGRMMSLDTAIKPTISLDFPPILTPRAVAVGAYRCASQPHYLPHVESASACAMQAALDPSCSMKLKLIGFGKYNGKSYCNCVKKNTVCKEFMRFPKHSASSNFAVYEYNTAPVSLVNVSAYCSRNMIRVTGNTFTSPAKCALVALDSDLCAATQANGTVSGYSNPNGDIMYNWWTGECRCRTTRDSDGNDGTSTTGCARKASYGWGLFRTKYIVDENIQEIGHDECVLEADANLNKTSDKLVAYFKAAEFCLHEGSGNDFTDKCIQAQSYCTSVSDKGSVSPGCTAMLTTDKTNPCPSMTQDCFLQNCVTFMKKLRFSSTEVCKQQGKPQTISSTDVFNGKNQQLLNRMVNFQNCIPKTFFS